MAAEPTREALGEGSPWRRHTVIEERVDHLPSDLSSLDDEGVQEARRGRDERMSYLFKQWPELTKTELQELERLSGERQRLARHYGGQREARLGRLALVPPPGPMLVEAAQATAAADARALDRVAWNTPRDPATLPDLAAPEGLDWDSFRDLYHPDSRRHNLTAIVAYGDYKRSGEVPSSAPANAASATASSDTAVAEWEGEGGAV